MCVCVCVYTCVGDVSMWCDDVAVGVCWGIKTGVFLLYSYTGYVTHGHPLIQYICVVTLNRKLIYLRSHAQWETC